MPNDRQREYRPRGACGAHSAPGHVYAAGAMSPAAYVALQGTTSLQDLGLSMFCSTAYTPGSLKDMRAAPSEGEGTQALRALVPSHFSF